MSTKSKRLQVLAINKVVSKSDCRVRILCLDNIKDSGKLIRSIPYPCYDINLAIDYLESYKDSLFYVDFLLDSQNELSSIPTIMYSKPLSKVKRISSLNYFKNVLNKYNPYILGGSFIKIASDLDYYTSSGWFSYKGNLICRWKPHYKVDNIFTNIHITDGVLVYRNVRPMYILCDGDIRHEPTEVGEVLYINLSSFVSSIRVVKADTNYVSADFIFDRALGDWVLQDKISRPIIGKKFK